jgi:hypothetical protein
MTRPDRCPSLEVFSAYLVGELPSSIERGFEVHVAECSACARVLEREASLEVALHDAADHLTPARSRSWAQRWTNATSHGVGAVAAAASVLLTLGLSSPWLHDEPSGDGSIAMASFSSNGDLLSCIPTFDEPACDDAPLVAQRDTMRVPWTELPEPIDPATCWSEDETHEPLCTPTDASG